MLLIREIAETVGFCSSKKQTCKLCLTLQGFLFKNSSLLGARLLFQIGCDKSYIAF